MGLTMVPVHKDLTRRSKARYQQDKASRKWQDRQRIEQVKEAFRPVSWFSLTAK